MLTIQGKNTVSAVSGQRSNVIL